LFCLPFLLVDYIYHFTQASEKNLKMCLFENKMLDIREGFGGESKNISIEENTTPPIVTGNVRETENYPFNFYVFEPSNYSSWKNRGTYSAYVYSTSIKYYDFHFTPDHSGEYYFVVGSSEPPQERTVILTATLEYREKITSHPYLEGGIIITVVIPVLMALAAYFLPL